MSTLTATSPAQADAGLTYAQNVGRALRALFVALFPVAPRANAEKRVAKADSVNLFHLYKLANQGDSVMPNLAQELKMIAARQQ